MEGKIVWITGAGSGIGRACALAFSRAGARVALTGRRREPLDETAALVAAAGGTAMIAPADVADAGEVARAHQEVVAAWGGPDVLINNAGMNVTRRHWADLSPERMSGVIDVLLKGPFQCSLAVLPAMRAKGGGTLIQIASLAGVMIHTLPGPSYSAAKRAVIAMSDSLNAEEGIHGIRSICISPGETETPILDTRPAPPSAADRALMLQAEDVAETALFCASLPPRACVKSLVITPTDDNAFRDLARRVETMVGRG